MRTVMLFAATGTCLFATPPSAHHSDAALDLNALHTIEGVVTDYRMRNPHGYFTVETTDENGQSVEWSVQMGSALSVSRRGWTRDTLTVGDQVIVGVRPARDGRSYGMLATLEKDGIPITYERFRVPETGATTRTLEGIWITDRASLGPDRWEPSTAPIPKERSTSATRAWPCRTPRSTPWPGAWRYLGVFLQLPWPLLVWKRLQFSRRCYNEKHWLRVISLFS